MSSEDQRKKGYSLPEQAFACQAKAETLAESLADPGGRARGPLQVVDFAEDAPGDLLDRPALNQLREYVQEYRPAAVVCLHPDRFARSLLHQLLVYQEITGAGTPVHFVQVQFEDTPEGRLFFSMVGAVAEYEKAKIQERTTRGRRGKLKRGGLPWKVGPYGYRWDAVADQPVPCPQAAHWVQEMFRWVVEEELGPYQVAKRLNEMGVPTARGGKWWYKQNVQKLLRHPIYKGEAVVNRTDQTGMHKNRFLPPEQRQRRRQRPTAEWVTVPVAAIVPAPVWEQAQAVLNRVRKRQGQHPRHQYLLGGLTRCGLCAARVHGCAQRQADAAPRRYLACSRRHLGSRQLDPAIHGTEPCRLPYLRAPGIEASVWRQVARLLENPDLVMAECRALCAPDAGRARLGEQTQLLAAARAADAELRRLRRLYQAGLVESEPAVEAEMATLQRRGAALRRQAAERAPAPPAAAWWNAPDLLMARFAASLSELTFDQRRWLVRRLVDQVVLYPDQPPALTWRQD